MVRVILLYFKNVGLIVEWIANNIDYLWCLEIVLGLSPQFPDPDILINENAGDTNAVAELTLTRLGASLGRRRAFYA